MPETLTLPTVKHTRAQYSELCGIVHRRNLYHRTKGRCFHPKLSNVKRGSGDLTVEVLHSGERFPYVDGEFNDGYAKAVAL